MSAAEILYGVERAGWGDVRRRAIERGLSRVSVERPDRAAIEIYASPRAESERRGHALGQKVDEADRWVPTAALRLRLPLLSDDSILSDVPSLVVLTSDDG